MLVTNTVFQCLWKLNFMHISEFYFINLETQMDTGTLAKHHDVWNYVFRIKILQIGFHLHFPEGTQRPFRVRYCHYTNIWLFKTLLNLVDIEKCETCIMSWKFIIFPTTWFVEFHSEFPNALILTVIHFYPCYSICIMVIFFTIINRFHSIDRCMAVFIVISLASLP